MGDYTNISLEGLVAAVRKAETQNEWTPDAEERCLELFRRALGNENQECLGAIYEIFRPRVERWLFKTFGYNDSTAERNYFRDMGVHRFYFALKGEKFYQKAFKSHRQVLVYWRKSTVDVALDFFTRFKRETPFSDLRPQMVDKFPNEIQPNIEIKQVSRTQIEDRMRHLLTEDEFQIAQFFYMFGLKPQKIRKHYQSESTKTEAALRVVLQRIKRKLRTDPTLVYWAKMTGIVDETN